MKCSQAELFVYNMLGAVYIVLGVFSLVRCRKILTFEWRQAQSFYVLVVLQCSLRALTLLLACDIGLQQPYIILLSTPDCLFIVTYLMLFWQLLTLFYYSHFDHQFANQFFREVAKRPQKSSTSLMFLFLLIVWAGTQFALILACMIGKIDSFSVQREIAIGDLITPTVALASMVCFQLKYSGIPLRGAAWRSKLVKMNIVVIVWSAGRLFSGALSIANQRDKNLDSPNRIYDMELIIVYLAASEIICIVIVLDSNFLQIFQIGERQQPDLQPLEPLSEAEAEAIEEPHFSIISTSPTIPPQEVTLLSDLPNRPSGFGLLKLGRYKEKEVVCRRLDFPRSSHFVIEGLAAEIEKLQALRIWGVLPYYGVVIQAPVITIVSPYLSGGSYYDILHDPNKKQRLNAKLTICQKVAHTLAELAIQQLHHGHLSSYNILLDQRNAPFLSDLGLLRIKKYATITLGYACKNAWSSPEILRDRAATVTTVTEQDDVYSFGMLLWETVTEKEPFPGMQWQKLAEIVASKGLRPEVPATVPSVVSQLILSCWNTQPERRPPFSLIDTTLQQYLQGNL